MIYTTASPCRTWQEVADEYNRRHPDDQINAHQANVIALKALGTLRAYLDWQRWPQDEL